MGRKTVLQRVDAHRAVPWFLRSEFYGSPAAFQAAWVRNARGLPPLLPDLSVWEPLVVDEAREELLIEGTLVIPIRQVRDGEEVNEAHYRCNCWEPYMESIMRFPAVRRIAEVTFIYTDPGELGLDEFTDDEPYCAELRFLDEEVERIWIKAENVVWDLQSLCMLAKDRVAAESGLRIGAART